MSEEVKNKYDEIKEFTDRVARERYERLANKIDNLLLDNLSSEEEKKLKHL